MGDYFIMYVIFFYRYGDHRDLHVLTHSFPTRRSSALHYALEVSGDSMVEVGILDGDYALIQKADTAREGDIVVALVDGQDATHKYFRREGPMIRLDPANSASEPQRYEAGPVIVHGRLSGLLRRYHPPAPAAATTPRPPPAPPH